jgi:prepilin-type N-terminal cleavage/methylation domain-containing protein
VHPAADDGYTLIELLVAMVLAGIVVGTLFQVLSGQGRFVEMQSSREEVQQNSRAALELLASEIRTVPAGAAIVSASRDSVTIRAPRIWGVVCALPGGGTLDLSIPAIGGATYSTNLGTGVVVNVGTVVAPIWTSAVPVTAIGAAASTCNGADLPPWTERRRVSISATPLAGSTAPAIGNVAYLYEQVTYRSGISASVPGTWIQRRIGDGVGATNQPMAGPVREEAGLFFQFFAGSSTTPLTSPVSSAADRAGITRVRVGVESVSRNRMGEFRESKADTLTVTLRNRF